MSRLDYLAASTWAGDAAKEHSVSETVPTTTRIPGNARGGLPHPHPSELLATSTPTPTSPRSFPDFFSFAFKEGRWMPGPSDIKMAVALRGNREGERKPIPNSHNYTPRPQAQGGLLGSKSTRVLNPSSHPQGEGSGRRREPEDEAEGQGPGRGSGQGKAGGGRRPGSRLGEAAQCGLSASTM